MQAPRALISDFDLLFCALGLPRRLAPTPISSAASAYAVMQEEWVQCAQMFHNAQTSSWFIARYGFQYPALLATPVTPPRLLLVCTQPDDLTAARFVHGADQEDSIIDLCQRDDGAPASVPV